MKSIYLCMYRVFFVTCISRLLSHLLRQANCRITLLTFTRKRIASTNAERIVQMFNGPVPCISVDDRVNLPKTRFKDLLTCQLV